MNTEVDMYLVMEIVKYIDYVQSSYFIVFVFCFLFFFFMDINYYFVYLTHSQRPLYLFIQSPSREKVNCKLDD